MRLNNKRVDLAQLATEMTAAGIPNRGLGTLGDDLHTYTVGGSLVDVPAGAAAVISAHVPPPPPIPLDYGSDSPPRPQLNDVVTQLRQYLQVANPTAAQSATALKLVIRVVLFTLQRLMV